MARLRSRGWCFTLNNYTEEEKVALLQIDCNYIVCGYEVGEQQTPHIQGYVLFNNPRDFNSTKRLLGERCHIEKQKGNCVQAMEYCKKDGNFEERGRTPQPQSEEGGKANKKRYEEAKKAAEEGRFDDIPADLYTRHLNTYHKMRDMALKQEDLDIDDAQMKSHFFWLHGPTGTGKSHTARALSKQLGCSEPYLKQLNKWWNDYRNQKVTIIEEADPKKCEHLATFFKQWADKWKFAADVKFSAYGGIRPEYLIVTSNYTIAECFPNEADYLPLERRFNQVLIERRGQDLPFMVNGTAQTLPGVILDPGSVCAISEKGNNTGMTFNDGETQAQKKRRTEAAMEE